jgi:hypothetical protein
MPQQISRDYRGMMQKNLSLKITEKQWEQTIHDLARRLGYKYYHTFRSQFSEPGYLDCTLLRVSDKRLIFVELKVGRNKLSPAQQEWYDALKQIPNVEVYVWPPEEFDNIVKILS